jgi:hypothetical protein
MILIVKKVIHISFGKKKRELASRILTCSIQAAEAEARMATRTATEHKFTTHNKPNTNALKSAAAEPVSSSF